MSVTSQMTTFSDLFTALQNAVRVTTGVTATENQAKSMINTALHDMHISFAESMPWAEREGVIATQPTYTTGTLVATIGSTALVGTGTAFDTNNDHGRKNVRVGGKIVIDGSPEVYRIITVTDDTNLVINTKWIDATTTESTYVYFEDEYDLDSDFARPLDFQVFDQSRSIKLIGRNEFRRQYPRNKTTGKPLIGTIVDREFVGNTTPVRRIRFFQPPDAVYIIPYNYITTNLAVSASGVEAANLSSDTDEPIVPLRFRHAIFYHALARWYRDKKDDKRSGEAKSEYTSIMVRIATDLEIGRSRPNIRPNVTGYKSRAISPYRALRGRRYTSGDAFDQRRT